MPDEDVWDSRHRAPGSTPRVIVIGAGIAGLSTGCYAQMSGMRTRIFEKHVLPGGCCTASGPATAISSTTASSG